MELFELLKKFMPNFNPSSEEKTRIVAEYSARLKNFQRLDSLDLSGTAPMSFPPKKRSR